jgi:chromate transporter
MIYIKIFWALFIPGILGYGGGPSSIPLVENEVVDHYHWMTVKEFSEILAMGNSLPGPIATKMGGYIGYAEGGVIGAIVGVFAAVAPSMILMIALLSLLMKHKESPRVKRMTVIVRPVIAVLLGVMTYDFLFSSYKDFGFGQTFFIGVVSYILMEKLKIHPAYVIAGALVYGGIFLA